MHALMNCFEAAAHGVATSRAKDKENSESELALAFRSSARVLAALVAASREAEARRLIFARVAASAWAAFEDSLNFRPAVADALAALLFQVLFFLFSNSFFPIFF